jgi:hypothetical protein
MPENLNALMPVGEFANTREEADALDRAVALQSRIRNGDQFANKSDAFRAGLVNFVSADQAPRRAFLGTPYISDDESARLRQNYPWAYHAGQGAGLVGTSLIEPAFGAGLLGAAVYNSPAVQRTFRDYALPAAAALASPYWLLRRAFQNASRNKLLEE